MSDETTRNFFYHDPFISSTNNYSYSFSNTNHDHDHDQLGFDPQYMMSFTNFDQSMQSDHHFVQSNSEMFSMVQKGYHNLDDQVAAHELSSATPISSMSSSSNEAGGDEDKSKKNMEDSSKKMESKEKTGIKKKSEKKERQTRFAFMTKSEVDHLEDGYRWRKYGQKAVKNSPFPRSYYRCTTQKCTVKKRVERCYEDPSTVVTTYEGQHNHPLPSNMRGSSGAAVSNDIFSTQSILPANFLKDSNNMFANHMAPMNHIGTSSICFPPDQNSIVHDQHYFPDYGLLQDMLPSMFFLKHEQHHQ